MALNWNWNEKAGEMIYTYMDNNGNVHEATASLYEGNAFLIFLSEFEENGKQYWNMHSFWVDEEHMKNMLGLNPKKGYSTNEYYTGSYKAQTFRFNKAKCRHLNKIVPALVKAFDNITIEIYSEE